MEHITQIFLAIFASTSFWACVQAVILKRMNHRSAERAALLGLLHNELVDKAEMYLNRGYITESEYRDLSEYVFQPYKGLGGNGTGEAYMGKVQELIFKQREAAERGRK